MMSLAILLASALVAASEEVPPVVGGSSETRSAAAGFVPTLKAVVEGRSQPAWIGYAAPVVGQARMCCYDSVKGNLTSGCAGCRLEREGAFTLDSAAGSGLVRLDPPRAFMVLLRAESGRVGKVRAFSLDCALDTGGLPLVWLTGVRPVESISYLESLAKEKDAAGRRRRDDDAVLAAIAHHDGPAADNALERLVTPELPSAVRKQAAFWMGQARGRRGYASLARLVGSDADDGFREHVVFALSESEIPEALDAIIEVARSDRSRHVRGQALFWLSQKAGRRAAAAITDALRDDPDTAIKKKAVFALSQLPSEEGVPRLIQTARTHRDPAIRKEAMFWLGQSNDPRALAFFEEVLSR